MTIALFAVLLLAGMTAAIAPLARRPSAWPADPPDRRDDVARAASSLRDLEFARAAGTIAPADYARLRGALERDAFAQRVPEQRGPAPVRTIVAASLIAAVVVGVAVFYLPPSAGDRAPGETVTGTVPQTDALAALEARASANPGDIPTQLGLADAYVQAGRPQDAIPRYRAVLANDPNNVRVETASARPRTHSAAPRCAARIRLDSTIIQPMPATSIAPSSMPKWVTQASARHPTANTTVATAVIASVDWRLRHPGKTAAPSSPPRPRQPTRAPYATGPRPNDVFATSGSSAQSALANATNAGVRTMTLRSAGVCRT